MKAALAVWNNRIAPLFDVAPQIHVVALDQGIITAQTRASIDGQIAAHKTRQLAEMGIETLMCGAISRFLQSMVTAYGMGLFAFIKGDLAKVIDAWQGGRFHCEAFIMPGCR